VLWEASPVRTEVLSQEESWLMVDMMKDVVRRGTAASVWGSGFRVPAAGKTGTTNEGADVWFVGFTPELVAGVWMGFDRPKKIQSNAQGGRLAAPAWTAFMTEVYQRRPPPPDWPRPEAITVREVDRTNGMLPNPFCPTDVVAAEYFIAGTEPVRECTTHSPFNVTVDSLGGLFLPPPPGAGGPPARRDSARRDTTRRPPPPPPPPPPAPPPASRPPR
jgi:penicillin-binding protein 1A